MPEETGYALEAEVVTGAAEVVKLEAAYELDGAYELGAAELALVGTGAAEDSAGYDDGTGAW